jgi:hypothetical protein
MNMSAKPHNYEVVKAALTSIASNLRDYGPDVRDNISAQLYRLSDTIDQVSDDTTASDLVRGVACLVKS